MKIIKSLLVAITLLFTTSVKAVSTVTVTLTDQSVGQVATAVYDDGTEHPYWAGVVMLEINGVEHMAMSTVPWFEYDEGPRDPDMVDQSPWTWETELVTRDDILQGYFGAGASDFGGLVAPLFLDGLLGYDPPDPLWTASYNEMVGDILWGTGSCCMKNAETVYDPVSGLTLLDVYNSTLPTLDPNYDYSQFTKVLSVGPAGLGAPMLVFAPVPVPPALWLFGPGLLGLIGIARCKVAA